MGGRVESRWLQSLPNELLLKIFGHVPYNFLRASVTRVCKHFKELVDKIEMKSLELNVTFPERDILEEKANGRKKHPMFTILQKFLLRQAYHNQFSWLPPSYDRFRRLFEHLTKHPKMFKEIRTMTVKIQDRSWYYWYFQQNGMLDSLPYLEHLTLSPPPLFSMWFPEPTFDHRRRALRSLRLDFLSLTSQGYRSNPYEGIIKVIRHHLHWLDVHKLRIDSLDDAGEHFLRDQVTFIRDLWCVGCKNYETATTATELIRSSTALVRFIFEINVPREPGCRFLRRFTPPQPSPFSFYSRGLHMHKCTLQQLVIASSEKGIIPRHWTLGPLDAFCQLKKLAVPFFMLPKTVLHDFCYELLPPNLQDLQIEYPFDRETIIVDDKPDLKEIRSGVGKMKSSLPYLKRLIMWHQKSDVQIADMNGDVLDHVPLETLRRHELVCEELGVKFEWVAVSSFWDTPVGKALDAEGDVVIEKSRNGMGNLPTIHPTPPMV